MDAARAAGLRARVRSAGVRGAGVRDAGVRGVGPVLFVVAVALWVFGGWLTNHAIETHEGIDPYVRTQQLVTEIGNGNFPPQVLPDARLGAGTAFPRFYPPLPFLSAAAIAAVTGDVVVGVNLAFVLAAIAAGVAMWWSVRALGGSPWSAAGAAALYVAAPYHVFDANVRGALAEMWAFAWFPLVFVGAWRTVESRRVDLVFPISLAGLLLSHSISMFPVALAVALICGIAVLRRSWRALAALAAGAALAVGLSAWFLLPQQVELGGVRAGDPEIMLATDSSMARERIALRDLIGDRRDLFRGYTRPVRLENGDRCPLVQCGGRSLSLGPITLALPIAALLLFGYDRRRQRRGHARPSPLPSALAIAAVGWLAFVSYSFVFTSALPDAVAYMQFPWRALAPLTAVAALLWFMLLRGRRHGTAVLVALGTLAALTVPGLQRDVVDRRDQVDSCFTRQDVRAPVDSVGATCFASGDGFSPAAATGIGNRTGRSAFGFTAQAEFLPKEATLGSEETGELPARITEPLVFQTRASITSWERTGDGLRVEVESHLEAEEMQVVIVALPVTAFEFTRVRVDGAAFERFDANGYVGLILDGSATITVSRAPTWADIVGWVLSIATLAAVIAVTVRRRIAARATERAKLTS